MKRLAEVDLTDQAVKFAGNFLEDKFKSARDIEKSLVLNTAAHGFFMGARFFERAFLAPKWKFWIKLEWTDDQLMNEGIKASKAYVKSKGYGPIEFGMKMLIKATLSNAFREGLEWRRKNCK